jgi:hypothetical protein
MSGWLATAAPGTRVGIGVPAGDCFYIPGAPAAPASGQVRDGQVSAGSGQ